MESSELNRLLAEEYLHLQSVIEEFDSKALTIKAWSVTFSLAALGAAYAAKASSILLVASASALLFWLLEGYWKTFQYAYYQHAGELEAHFAGEKDQAVAMQIGRTWYKRWKAGGGRLLIRIMFWPHVALPHLAATIFGLLLYALHVAGLIPVSRP
ncbi:hypothetical protein [Lacimicrobium alkaliphilum]|uniref:Uncharacterized protein n=1 Tax=Lacimicrobium alkaliphilum TaxID=1526571 RepID=A0ABQ1RA34_9ALTE|nr:hypothetical protein [Lacimicrobium alkaliphilum]GGD62801.1 hypothetical protein GCM10011357_17630 [Lacimicrobium alkaliphilum]